MSSRLYEIVSKVFSIPIAEINDNSSPETIEKWDSFHGLVLVDTLETEFNVQFTLGEITEVNNIGDIKKIIISIIAFYKTPSLSFFPHFDCTRNHKIIYSSSFSKLKPNFIFSNSLGKSYPSLSG